MVGKPTRTSWWFLRSSGLRRKTREEEKRMRGGTRRALEARRKLRWSTSKQVCSWARDPRNRKSRSGHFIPGFVGYWRKKAALICADSSGGDRFVTDFNVTEYFNARTESFRALRSLTSWNGNGCNCKRSENCWPLRRGAEPKLQWGSLKQLTQAFADQPAERARPREDAKRRELGMPESCAQMRNSGAGG